jgi:2-polyprenyl-6-methoxyphenol hydroxylase-like FAD-dependent oxidoreductase
MRALFVRAARANGAVLRFGTKVEAIDYDGAVLKLTEGEVFSADLVVGANGSKSMIREMLFHGEEQTQETGLISFK